jgi:putative membrane protein
MSAEALGDILAPINATLNLTSTVLLVRGYRFIKRGDIPGHRRSMLGALTASALFLALYLLRFSLTGTHLFAGEGTARVIYLSILFSHMVLAVVIVPLVLRLLFLARKTRFQSHARLARWTFPLWLYVSLTGLVVYLFLYHIYGYA